MAPRPGYGGPYPQQHGAPMLNPAQPSFPPSNPAVPSFPPGQSAQGMQARPPQYQQQQGGHHPPQRAASHRSLYDRYSQLPPSQQQQAQPQPPPQQSAYDGVSLYDSAPSNGYGGSLGPSRAPSAYGQVSACFPPDCGQG